MFPNRLQPVYSPEGAQLLSGTPPAAPPPAPSAAGRPPAAGSPPAAPPAVPPAAGARPDWAPEKYWDAATNALNAEGLAKGYAELTGKLTTRRDEIETEVRNSILAKSGRPESAEKYEVKIPAEVKMPEGVTVAIDEKDPLLGWWRKTAFDKGLTQTDFEAGIAAFVQGELAGMPDTGGERKKLGENAEARIAHVDGWAATNLPPATYKKLTAMSTSAEVIEIMEDIIKISAKGGVGGAPGATVEVLTKQQLQEMQRDPRYHDTRKRDPAYVERVAEGFRRLAGQKK